MPHQPIPKTSDTDPLRIDEVSTGGGGGALGLTFCPGKVQPDAMHGPWARDLAKDIQAIRDWGASALVNLLEVHEMRELQVPQLAEAIGTSMTYFHLPIRDADIPGPDGDGRRPPPGGTGFGTGVSHLPDSPGSARILRERSPGGVRAPAETASYRALSGVALKVIGQLLGHRTSAMTDRYSRLADQVVTDAVTKVMNKLFG